MCHAYDNSIHCQKIKLGIKCLETRILVTDFAFVILQNSKSPYFFTTMILVFPPVSHFQLNHSQTTISHLHVYFPPSASFLCGKWWEMGRKINFPPVFHLAAKFPTYFPPKIAFPTKSQIPTEIPPLPTKIPPFPT